MRQGLGSSLDKTAADITTYIDLPLSDPGIGRLSSQKYKDQYGKTPLDQYRGAAKEYEKHPAVLGFKIADWDKIDPSVVKDALQTVRTKNQA
jgi:hypothetical protein